MSCKHVFASNGRRCRWPDVPGLEYCIAHMPDELLEEAEEISGITRCRHHFGFEDACHNLALKGSYTCTGHGGNLPNIRKGAARAELEQKLTEHLAMIMQGKGALLISPERIGDPLAELLVAAAEVKALKEIMREKVAGLISEERMRYGHKTAGEQLRAEILLYERALDRYVKILIEISKLRIEDRLAGVQEATAQMLERALDSALEESGVGLEGISGARKAFRRHLKVVQSELAK